MAILSTGNPFGFTGLRAGLQFATGSDNLFDAGETVRQSLIRDTEFNFANDIISRGGTTLDAAAGLGQFSPFVDRGLSRLGSAVAGQQALAPQAILQAQQGNFNPLNSLSGLFGGVGNFNSKNFNTVGSLPLLGASGVGQQVGIQNANLLQQLLLGQLGQRGQAQGPQANSPSFSRDFGGVGAGDGFFTQSTPSSGVQNISSFGF